MAMTLFERLAELFIKYSCLGRKRGICLNLHLASVSAVTYISMDSLPKVRWQRLQMKVKIDTDFIV